MQSKEEQLLRELKVLHRNQTIITSGCYSDADYSSFNGAGDGGEMAAFDFDNCVEMTSSWPTTQTFVLDCISEQQQQQQQRNVARAKRPTSLAIAGRIPPA